MSVPAFVLTDQESLLAAALVRVSDAIRILEFESDDSAARTKALRILQGVAA